MFTIGKLAGATGASRDTLRYYESEGLLTPAGKTASGYRLYDDRAVSRLRFIQQAQACGFTLTEIRELLALRQADDACCDDVRRRAVEKKLQLAAKMRAITAMSTALDKLIRECRDGSLSVEECPIITALEAAGIGECEGSEHED